MHPTDACRFEILIPGEQRFFLKAANSTERQRWIIALGSCKAGITNVNEVEKMRELFTSLIAFLLLLTRSMWDLVCAHISYFRIEVDYLGGNLLFSWLLFSRRYMSVLNYLPSFVFSVDVHIKLTHFVAFFREPPLFFITQSSPVSFHHFHVTFFGLFLWRVNSRCVNWAAKKANFNAGLILACTFACRQTT